jgi:hypothetical protein
MSTVLPSLPAHDAAMPPAAAPAPATASMRPASTSWLREPLLHFALLGLLLFVVDHVLVARRDDPRTIVVGAEVDREARETFKASRGRGPTEEELRALRQVWIDNEVLYREGLALQVDRGDAAIRERVIFKALSVVDANVKAPSMDDATLRRWFEQHRDKYDEPARYDFDEAVLTGDTSESAVRAFVDTLEHGAPGELQAGLRVFKGRPQANVVQSYGEPFAKALAGAGTGHWQALPALDGWRAVRLDAATPARPAAFDALRGVVLQDWTDATLADQRTAAVRTLAKKYTLKFDGAPK